MAERGNVPEPAGKNPWRNPTSKDKYPARLRGGAIVGEECVKAEHAARSHAAGAVHGVKKSIRKQGDVHGARREAARIDVIDHDCGDLLEEELIQQEHNGVT